MSVHARLSELDTLSSARVLTDAESEELYRCHVREDLRQRRLPARIMRLRAELKAAEAALWRCYLPELERLERRDAAETLARIEAELGGG